MIKITEYKIEEHSVITTCQCTTALNAIQGPENNAGTKLLIVYQKRVYGVMSYDFRCLTQVAYCITGVSIISTLILLAYHLQVIWQQQFMNEYHTLKFNLILFIKVFCIPHFLSFPPEIFELEQKTQKHISTSNRNSKYIKLISWLIG